MFRNNAYKRNLGDFVDHKLPKVSISLEMLKKRNAIVSWDLFIKRSIVPRSQEVILQIPFGVLFSLLNAKL